MTDATATRAAAPAPWSQLGLYLVLTAALSCIFYAFVIVTGHNGGGHGDNVAGLKWSPGVATSLSCLFNRTP